MTDTQQAILAEDSKVNLATKEQYYIDKDTKLETFAWSTGTMPPWEGQGNAVSDDLSVKEMLQAANLDWEVAKRPIYVKRGDAFVSIPNKRELVRTSDDTILSLVGPNWNPVQNEVAFDFFDKFVREGGMKMEAAGSMWAGRYIWALARVTGKDFTVGPKKGGDECGNYILLCSPHLLGKAMFLQHACMRFFCWNTMTFNLGAELNRKSSEFRVPHSMVFNDEAKEKAAVAMKLANKQSDVLKEATNKLAKAKATTEQVEEFFCELLDFDPKKKPAKGEKPDREPLMLPKFREALVAAPGQDAASAKGTWWGALNAITAVIDHNHGRERVTALRGAWLSTGARLKRKALTLALEKAS
jgi:phage/plasmid-like protein (TIGR03299 family)